MEPLPEKVNNGGFVQVDVDRVVMMAGTIRGGGGMLNVYEHLLDNPSSAGFLKEKLIRRVDNINSQIADWTKVADITSVCSGRSFGIARVERKVLDTDANFLHWLINFIHRSILPATDEPS